MQIRLLRRPIYRITKYVGKILSWNFTLLLKKLQKNLRDFCCTRCICLPAEQFHIMSTRGWHGKIFCTHSTWLSVFCYTFSSCPPHSLLLALHIIFLHLVFCMLFLLCNVIKTYVQQSDHSSSTTYRVAQKIWHTFCTRYNFIKYWPIFKYFSLSKSGENL